MNAFEDIVLEWRGTPYTIKGGRVMRAIAAVEDVVTFGELAAFFQRGVVPPAKVAMAFGALLRQAGAKVQDHEVYAGMFDDETAAKTAEAVDLLVAIMTPPATVTNAAGKGGPPSDPTEPSPPTPIA